jgi:hypothetical protein
MSISFDPTTLLYAVVEYLKSTEHLYDPVNHKPEHDGQYRLVCLAPNADDAARLAHLLRAMDDGTYWYSVCVTEPEPLLDDKAQVIPGDIQSVEMEPLNPAL